jgi:histone-lysine N-methyltransferase SETMAR
MDKIEYCAVTKFFVKQGLMPNEKIRPSLKNKKKIIFHQDNAPAHKSVLEMGKLRDLHYELLEHPPYSPDLAPSHFYLFLKLKLFLAG